MHNTYDPAKRAGEVEFHHCLSEHCQICGPAGNTTLLAQNEKAILETNLHGVIAMHQEADLGSDHDSHRQGIYTTNSIGDND